MLELLRVFKELILSDVTFKERFKGFLIVLIYSVLGIGFFIILYSIQFDWSLENVLIGFLLTIPFFIFLIYNYVLEIKKKSNEEYQISLLKINGDQVIVNLEKNIVSLYEMDSGNKCVVDFEFTYRNEKCNYPYLSDRSPESLQVNLLVKKEATLYINPKNIDERYLDLEFLNQ